MKAISGEVNHRPFPSPTTVRWTHAHRLGNKDLLRELLDDAEGRIQSPHSNPADLGAALDEMIDVLCGHYVHCTPTQWSDVIQICRTHSIMGLLHQDPFTYRAYSKPRGYAGDAVMLDYLYGREERWPTPEATPMGLRIFEYTTASPASMGVRFRRGYVAEVLDRMARQRSRPHVLSIASGHLREASLSASVKRGRIGRFVALDADTESLREVERTYGPQGVETVPAKIRALISGRTYLGEFDLVYSTGLFDYLEQRTGQRLVSHMFQMLRPGGQLIVANFLPGVRDVGYMEAFMDWQLIYRTRHDMVELTCEIPEAQIAEVRVFTEENQNIIFLRVIRR